MTDLFNRDTQLQMMHDATVTWDVLVIGGGATGLGIAMDAVCRGYKTILLERFDFAKGTSGRTTKLIHGGVRYLAQGDIRMVREASIERGLLCRNAPHLVRDQQFIIPVYNYSDLIKYTTGLKVYDWISGRMSLGSSHLLSKKRTLEALPGIRSKGLLGGVLYHDAQFDDARLAINLAQSIVIKGGCALNYVRVISLLKNEAGKLCGVVAKDEETGQSYEIEAKAVINATGVFVDEVLRMDLPNAEKTVCVSQGVHLVFDKNLFPSVNAMMIPQTSDGRVLFALPWYGHVIMGTTDTAVDEALPEPKALDEEVEFILDNAGAYLTAPISRKDVQSVFAGLRPLAAPGTGRKKTKEISRHHRILVSSSGLFTMLGGKWTTYRKMGEDMVGSVEKNLKWNHRKSVTGDMPLHGYKAHVELDDPFHFYGSDAAFIRESLHQGEWLSESLHIHEMQLHWAVKNEMCRSVEDFLSRRTRALLLDAKESIRICPAAARIMSMLLQRDKTWMQDQTSQFSNLAQNYLLKESIVSFVH